MKIVQLLKFPYCARRSDRSNLLFCPFLYCTDRFGWLQYSSGGFSKSPLNRWGWFFSPPRIFLIPHSNSHRDRFFVHRVSAEFPPQTTHLPVELRGGQKFIMASSQWKISDVRMIDSSEFFRVCMGRKSEPSFCLHIIRLICRWIHTEIFLPRWVVGWCKGVMYLLSPGASSWYWLIVGQGLLSL